MSIWNEQLGPDSDVVISSRVRIARNISGYPYTNMNDINSLTNLMEELNNIIDKIKKQLGLTWIDLRNTSPIDKLCYIENHLMSMEMLGGDLQGALVLNKDDSLSVMINEEDHLRIQSILPGRQLEMAYKICDDFEQRLGTKLNYSYDEKLGFLTSCPTNVGTGLRVSAMMHLPALTQTGAIKKILEACAKMGVAVRGAYGESSKAEGNIFQISNQVTLGYCEEEIIENMLHIINQIIEKERNLRQKILNSDKISLEDKIFRAYGILANTRRIESNEAMELMSWVRLGIDIKVIDFINPINMNKLLVELQPGNIQKRAGGELHPAQRDEKRADLCRQMMKKEEV